MEHLPLRYIYTAPNQLKEWAILPVLSTGNYGFTRWVCCCCYCYCCFVCLCFLFFSFSFEAFGAYGPKTGNKNIWHRPSLCGARALCQHLFTLYLRFRVTKYMYACIKTGSDAVNDNVNIVFQIGSLYPTHYPSCFCKWSIMFGADHFFHRLRPKFSVV